LKLLSLNHTLTRLTCQRADRSTAVTFLYPAGGGNAKGKLEDRYVLPVSSRGAVPYWDVVDLIDFPGERVSKWIRIGYYRRPGKRLVWWCQTTITEPASTWRQLLVGAAREKFWFRSLMRGVAQELRQDSSTPEH
jgi:hypothetical protein